MRVLEAAAADAHDQGERLRLRAMQGGKDSMPREQSLPREKTALQKLKEKCDQNFLD